MFEEAAVELIIDIGITKHLYHYICLVYAREIEPLIKILQEREWNDFQVSIICTQNIKYLAFQRVSCAIMSIQVA